MTDQQPDIFRELSDSIIRYIHAGMIVLNATLPDHDNRVYLKKLNDARQLGGEAVLEIYNGNERLRYLTDVK